MKVVVDEPETSRRPRGLREGVVNGWDRLYGNAGEGSGFRGWEGRRRGSQNATTSPGAKTRRETFRTARQTYRKSIGPEGAAFEKPGA